jgi:lysocardiolipin and lysophospholipid acyltransferase
MQFFNFIFLARSWASDRLQLASHLSSLAKEAEKKDKPFSLIIYPEGTLVSKDTRPISKKFADKQGIPDLTNILLPRSTGLHYSLRALAPRIPNLKLIDVTVVYPGVPPVGYGQDYYTLRSIFCDRVPPPAIHMHLRLFDVSTEVPIGSIGSSLPNADIPESEKSRFDIWLQHLWREKDESMSTYFKTDSFMSGPSAVIPLRLRRKRETLDSFIFFLPLVVGWVSRRLGQ